ncbi:MAG: Trk family potassium uptake protein [Firmicutes bacterium]|nr:Trk family potassium uptake protein [Bacillota bacterium]
MPAQILVLGFGILILLGAILLSLPIASSSGERLPFLDALFTSTSAVAVTGLVVVDTGTYFSLFGQLVILVLIQIGGLGFMTMTTLLALLLGKRISLRERLIMQEALNKLSLSGVVHLTVRVLQLAAAFEAVGAFFLAFKFVPLYGWAKGIYYSIFHSISAFNNAGFDLMGGFRSLQGFQSSLLVNTVIAVLVICGGLGFTVLLDIGVKRRFSRLSLHSKVVIIMTVVLLVLGCVVFFLLEYSNQDTLGRLTLPRKMLVSFFQSVVPRTAGFSTVDIGRLTSPTLFFLIFLMFIGASPGSTGGGIKTSTAGALLAAAWSVIQGNEEVELLNRRLPKEIVYRALAIFLMALGLLSVAAMGLAVTEPYPFLKVLFEAASAFGTVGLSTGITPELSAPGKIIIILLMYIGRLGPMTAAAALAQRMQAKSFRFPEEKIVVG